MLENHGLSAWGKDSKSCYLNTVDLISRAARYLNEKMAGKAAFGGEAMTALAPEARASVAASLMPRLRAAMGSKKIGHSPTIPPRALESSALKGFGAVSPALGTSCPDHFLRTKICAAGASSSPRSGNPDAYLAAAMEEYRKGLRGILPALHEAGLIPGRCAISNPVIVSGCRASAVFRSLPGDKTTARLAS